MPKRYNPTTENDKNSDEELVFTLSNGWVNKKDLAKGVDDENMQTKINENGELITPKPAQPESRKSYQQDWESYNRAQTSEKHFIQKILDELLCFLPEEQPKRGRPTIPLRDQIFAMCLHQFIRLSSRRLSCDILEAHNNHYLFKNIHFNTLLKFYDNPALTPILKSLIETSAKPLSLVESHFSVDSSGFSLSQHLRWFDAKYHKEVSRRMFRKAHITSGSKTNIITAVNITEGVSADCVELPDLIKRTAVNFNIAEVSADKAYLSRKNLNFLNSMNIVPYIPFKSNSTIKARGNMFWHTCYKFFIDHQTEFYNKYHLRSNVESTFSMIKRKFGVNLRSKKEIAQTNEILAKCLVHNLSVLCMEFYSLGIDIDFMCKPNLCAT